MPKAISRARASSSLRSWSRELFQADPFDVLHCQVAELRGDAGIVEGDDIWVIQGCGRARFPQKSRYLGRVLGDLRVEDFQDHDSV